MSKKKKDMSKNVSRWLIHLSQKINKCGFYIQWNSIQQLERTNYWYDSTSYCKLVWKNLTDILLSGKKSCTKEFIQCSSTYRNLEKHAKLIDDDGSMTGGRTEGDKSEKEHRDACWRAGDALHQW